MADRLSPFITPAHLEIFLPQHTIWSHSAQGVPHYRVLQCLHYTQPVLHTESFNGHVGDKAVASVGGFYNFCDVDQLLENEERERIRVKQD